MRASQLLFPVAHGDGLLLDDPDLLEQRMKAMASGSPGETVFLRADKLIPYGEVLIVMDRIRKAGVTRIALVTIPTGGPRGSAR